MASLITPVLITCPSFKNGARGLEICLPGGGCISYMYPGLWASPAEICQGLLGQLQGALVPMKPLFDVIAAVNCLGDVIQAIPDAITEGDVPGLKDAITECIPKVENLLQLVPQLSVPLMVCQTLDVLICVIDGAITMVQEFIFKQAAILEAALLIRSSSDPLFGIIECANRLNQNRYCAINESLSGINAIIELLNIFLKLIGLDPLPTFGEMVAEATGAVEQFRVLVTTLRAVRQGLGCGPMLNVPRC